MHRQTYHAKNDDVPRQWRHIDADGQVLGRLAARVAFVLMGKDKPQYTPHHDVGDFVVVTNAEKIILTGTKLDTKYRETYSGHPSGRKLASYREVLASHPQRLIEDAVRRMMPRTKLARAQFAKLKVYAGPDHPHQAQQPQPLDLTPAVA